MSMCSFSQSFLPNLIFSGVISTISTCTIIQYGQFNDSSKVYLQVRKHGGVSMNALKFVCTRGGRSVCRRYLVFSGNKGLVRLLQL